MTRTRPFQNAFSSGEIDPLLHARSDFQRHQTGLAKCRGFLPLRQGGVTRAPGTIYRGTTRSNQLARRVPFEFSADDALELEFTNLRMRVWRYGALVTSGGSPYELTTPFPESSLDLLQWVQDKDVVYITDGLRPVQKLSRFALNSWTIADAVFKNGPFRNQNTDEAVTIQASAANGSITLTGVGSPFTADMVGSLILLEPTDMENVSIWGPDQERGDGHYVVSDGKIFQRTGTGGGTGIGAPVHEGGEQRTSAATWYTYRSDLKGVAKITAFTNANLVSAQVMRSLPLPVVDDPTWHWSEGAWSGKYGYPACLELYEQRLWAARTPSEPRTLWGSTIGDFEDFLPTIEDDAAFAYTISAAQTQNEIRWLFRGRHGLFIGALGEVMLGLSNATDQVIGPKTFFTEQVSAEGVSDAQPIAPYGYPIHISKGGTRLQELRSTLNEEQGEPLELSLPSQHLAAAGFEQVVWQSVPQRIAWLRDAGGQLIAMTYDPSQDVLGWAVVPIAGGFVEAMSVTPAADGLSDTLTLVVRRTIDGQTVRTVEELANNDGLLVGTKNLYQTVHFFCAIDPGTAPATDTFAVPHLVGETVWAWTTGGVHGPLTVPAGGNVVLPVAVTRAVIGLFDASHHVETLDLEAQARDGSSRGRLRRLEGPVGIDVHATAAGRVRAIERELGQADHAREVLDIVPLPVGQDLTNVWSGTAAVDLETGECGAVRLRFEPIGGAPLTITGITPQLEEVGA